MITEFVEISKTFKGNEMEIRFKVLNNHSNMQEINKAMEIVDNGKILDISIKQYRKKRSLDANGMLWVILNEIAIVLGTSKDEVYLEMLSRYGVFTHVIVKLEVVEKIKREWRTVKELGEVTVNGQTGIQLQCYFGSSTYNTKEFSTLLEGVIYEAKELGIDTITDREKEELLSKWEGV